MKIDDPKFSLSQIVYVTKLVPVFQVCNACDGEKVIHYRDFNFVCPKCNGTGKLHKCNQKQYEVNEAVVTSIKITLSLDRGICIRYKVKPDNSYNISRSEDNLFSSRDEAEKWCNIQNQMLKEKKELKDNK